MIENSLINNSNNYSYNSNSDEDSLSDDYLLKLQIYLREMKKQRKNEEEQCSYLGNRIKKLKLKDNDSKKKLNLTQKKFEIKKNQQEEYEKRKNMKNFIKNLKEKEILKNKKNNKLINDKIKTDFLNKQEQKKIKLENNIKLNKLQKKNNEDMIKVFEFENLQNNKKKVNYIKNQYENAAKKKKIDELKKKKYIKKGFRKKNRRRS